MNPETPFSCKVAPFTPAGERTKKAPSRGGRTGSNGQQHPVVIDCEVLQKRRSRCTAPGELRAVRRMPPEFRRLGPLSEILTSRAELAFPLVQTTGAREFSVKTCRLRGN